MACEYNVADSDASVPSCVGAQKLEFDFGRVITVCLEGISIETRSRALMSLKNLSLLSCLAAIL